MWPGIGQELLRYDTKSTSSRKNRKIGYHRDLQSFVLQGEKTICRMGEWETIFATHVSDRRQISRIYKELLQVSTKKTANPMKTQVKI